MNTPLAVPQRRPLPSRTVQGVALVLMAALCFAISAFIASRIVGAEVKGVTIAFLEAVFGFVFVSGLWVGMQWKPLLGKPRARVFSLSSLAWLVLAATATALGFGGFYSAMNHENLSVISPVTGAVPLVSYVLILLLLRGEERLTTRAVLGAVLVVSGVVIIGLVNN